MKVYDFVTMINAILEPSGLRGLGPHSWRQWQKQEVIDRLTRQRDAINQALKELEKLK